MYLFVFMYLFIFTWLWFCMFRGVSAVVTADLYFCWDVALSFFLTVCVFCSLKVVFTHETTPRFTCAEFKKLEVGTVFKVKGDGRPYPPCRPSLFLLIHTHTYTPTAQWTVRVMNGAEMCSRAVEVPGQACRPPTTTQIFMRLYVWETLGHETVRLVFSATPHAVTTLGGSNMCRLIK